MAAETESFVRILPVLAIIVVSLGFRLRRAVRPRWVPLWSLWVLPVVFLVGGAAGLQMRPPRDTVAWASALLLLLPAGWVTAPVPMAVDKAKKRLQIPGSIWAVLRLVVIIAGRFALGFLMAQPGADRPTLFLATSILSGCVAGYYIGHSFALLRAWRQAPA